MRYRVLGDIDLETSTGTLSLHAGQLIALPEADAAQLCKAGAIEAYDPYAYEERAGIMEFDGGLSKEEAERLAWCNHACGLRFKSQWATCERYVPIPCPKLTPALDPSGAPGINDTDAQALGGKETGSCVDGPLHCGRPHGMILHPKGSLKPWCKDKDAWCWRAEEPS